MVQQQQTYHRIAISGDPGSGKTTFAREVAKQTGYELITTGNIFRKLAQEKGVSITELNKMAETQKEIDYKVDHFLQGLNVQPGDYVLDSRMAWHFVKGAFKIRLTVKPEVAVDRVFSDDAEMREKYKSLEEAKNEIRARRDSEIKRYRDLYDVDIGDPENFDLLIDTSEKSLEETMSAFWAAYKDCVAHASKA